MEEASRLDRSRAPRLHRRNLDKDQHGAVARLVRARAKAGRQSPARTLETLTFLAALRCGRIDAPCVFDGPINGVSFAAYVDQSSVNNSFGVEAVCFFGCIVDFHLQDFARVRGVFLQIAIGLEP